MRNTLLTCAALFDVPDRSAVTVAGLVITRQRPGTASGVIFLTLEDETGIANVIVWPRVYERNRRTVMTGRLLRVTGRLQREGTVMHLIAWRLDDLSRLLDDLGMPVVSHARADEGKRPVPPRQPPRARHPREQAKALFPSRDFH